MLQTLLRLVLALAVASLTGLLLPEKGGSTGWSLFPPVAAVLVAVATGRLLVEGRCAAVTRR